MGILINIRNLFRRSEPAQVKQEPAERTPRTGGGFPLLASTNALNIATVYRCVNLLADSVAMLPVQYMRKKAIFSWKTAATVCTIC